MKKIIAVLLSLIFILSFVSCSKSEDAFTVNVGVLKGPTGMGSAYLMEQNSLNLTENRYNFTVSGAADALTAMLVSGEVDIAALPTNAICALYNKTGGKISVLGINTLSVLYIVSRGEKIGSVSDLDGKSIVAAGKGSTAEFVLGKMLTQYGANLNINWVSEHSETSTLLLSGKYDVALLPEPFVTSAISKDSGVSVALDLNKEWTALGLGELTMGGIAVRREFYENHKDAVDTFVREYGMSIDFTNQNPKDSSLLIEKYGIAAAEISEKAIPRSNIVWLHSEDYKGMLSGFLTTVYESSPESVGGSLPNYDFYIITE